MNGAYLKSLLPLLLVFLGLIAPTVASSASSPTDQGAIVISSCAWRTGSGCPRVPSHCSLERSGGQDPICTPGALNPAVRPSTLDSTICKSGYTNQIRPPTSYTDPLKLESMAAYGLGRDTSAYEFDHLVPLELGGAPADIRNLWPESHHSPSFSYRKDGLENSLNAQVCDGEVTLAGAQRMMIKWIHYVSTKGGEQAPPPEPAPLPPPPAPESAGNCDPAYPTVCIPPPPPDLDCSQIPYRNFKVLPPDPDHFDGNGNGIGCES